MHAHASPLRELRRLLSDPGSEPLGLARALAAARQQLMLDAATQWELARFELAFLRRLARRDGTPEPLRAEVAQARLAEVRVETRIASSRAPEDPAALFDLAEQCALYRVEGLAEDEAIARDGVRRRLETVAPDRGCIEEARERFAALATEEEDLQLQHRILLLEEMRAVLDALAERASSANHARLSDSGTVRRPTGADTGQRELQRMASRIGRMHCDRVLVRRLERWLSPLGARALELTSLFLLVVVFGLLIVEASFTWSDRALHTFQLVDGFICVFFIAEFALKLTLAPARGSWFVRHMLTDLLPAIPAALALAPVAVPASGEDVVVLRLLRFFRITYFARYMQAMRPLLRVVRLVLFLVKGMDGLVRRFSPLLNRNFVFFDEVSLRADADGAVSARELAFRALRREQILLAEVEADAHEVLLARARILCAHLAAIDADAERPTNGGQFERDVPVETAIRVLYGLRVQDLLQVLSHADVLAIDRVVRVVSAPFVRALPIVHHFAVAPELTEPAGRVVALAHNIALYLERWRSRLVFFADLHGIVTGPQLLDRVASAMVKASQRPAVRLLLFGGLFFLVRMLIGAESGPGLFLKKFVAAPLVVLGSVCAVFLSLGWWLKRLAGEASDAFKLTSEAAFIALLESVKTRREHDDAAFLARRLFRWEMPTELATAAILDTVRVIRNGRSAPRPVVPALLRDEVQQTGLLHLHYLDGSLMHPSDVKTTEQLLANPSLENVRTTYLKTPRKERRRLRKLSLTDGSMLGGPYMWFSFITESIAVETAKRVTEYNRNCLTKEQRRFATDAELADFQDWVSRRRLAMTGRTLKKLPPPGGGELFRTTEFCALDFVSGIGERDEHIDAAFGPDVLELLRADRRRMVREVFGMRPLHRLPRSQRSFNFFTFYSRRLSGGRALLLPVFFVLAAARGVSFVAGKTAATVREILRPHQLQRRRVSGRAPFTVALRKIRRMKAPSLIETMRLRAAFDPEYCGVPATWSDGAGFDETSELDRDMTFLLMSERQREPLHQRQRQVRELVAAWQPIAPRLTGLSPARDDLERRLRERALTIVWVLDHQKVRSLYTGREWLRHEVPRLGARDTRVPVSAVRRLFGFVRHGLRNPVDAMLDTHFADLAVAGRARRNLRRAFWAGDRVVRDLVAASREVPAGRDWQDLARERLRRLWVQQSVITRDLCAVRTVQSLTVLDVRNYRELVFALGEYDLDGEDRTLAYALP
ncbi:MAG: hypothetical protein R3F56_09620 [Planctomycetota bacterium]